MKFNDLKLTDSLLKALNEQEYTNPTPIQEQAIPHILARRDILGCAQTGTGKTAAFSLPILQHLANEPVNTSRPRNPRVLVVAPTRELVAQIKENVLAYSKYIKIKTIGIFGGVSQKPQEVEIRKGVDFLIATPGRLLDLINQKILSLKDVEYLVLDEADRMLDMGFINDIKKILKFITKKHQTLFFSATMAKEIKLLADSILSNPVLITVTPEVVTIDLIQQYLYYVDKNNKKKLLMDILREKKDVSVLIFTRTKHGANNLVKELGKSKVDALAIHGNKSQNARTIALADFKAGKLKILIATDIVARGIDISELPCVINYDVTNEPETYVHRIGRTGRAGAKGVSITFCSEDEVPFIFEIEKLINKEIDVVEEHNYIPDFYNSLKNLKVSVKEAKKKQVKKETHNFSNKNKSRSQSNSRNNFKNKNRNKR